MYQLPPDPFDAAETARLTRRPWLSRRRVQSVAVVLLMPTMLILFALFGLKVIERDAAESATTLTPTVAERARVDLSRPYDNTPAASWAEGEAGIVAPPPTQVGPFAADHVAMVMERVRQLIVAARLNRHVLATHDAEPVLAQLSTVAADDARTQLRPGNEAETWWVSAKIAAGFSLLPVTPRVTGTMTPIVGADGQLTVRTNYLVAYAFDHPEPAALTGPLDIVVVDRWEIDYEWFADPAYDEQSQGMYIADVRGSAFPVNCALSDKGFLAPDYSNPPITTGGQTQASEKYFDPNAPIVTEGGC
ncbi:hypothetical protein [Nocardia asteroides]|uniref:hypothetical protein n=1 Tax=Nocardia asteroides TaxID=1824 RepID=UPI001E295F0C|nr:hypothetical protein [Nocardia asteroides]UGT54202.1 hypothetical protein LTT85_26705 [Nocardia asteroides]